MHKTRQQRRENALILQEERGKRSAKEQLALLDKRLGNGVGAKKERAKLAKEMGEK